MAEHTPGPWMAWNIPSAGWQVGTKAQFDRRSKGEMVGYGNIAGLAFYQCRPGHDGGPFITTAQEESEAADAHLLAAAPDLLAACEEGIALIEGWDAGATEEDVRRVMGVMNNAIAKARGTT